MIETPSPLTPRQLNLSYEMWKQAYQKFSCDNLLEPFMNHQIHPDPPNGSWIRTTRHSLLLSTNTLSKRLKISTSAYCRLERSESMGSIQLSTLKKVASAMDCELVYALRPTNHLPHSKRIWHQVLLQAMNGKRFKRANLLKANTLAAEAKSLMNQSGFRKDQDWTERKN